MTAQKGQLWSLQAGRAVAAMAVVAHHATASTETFAGQVPVALSFFADRGYLGVDFFFVLSGFIIHYVNRDTPNGWLPRYAWSRTLRVYAPYLPVGIGIALIYTLVPGLSAGSREWSWLSTLTLLPGADPALIVAWTLQYELAFYFVFALAKLWGRPILGVAIWAAAVSPFVGTIVFEFLFGMLAVELVGRRTLIPAALSFAAYCVFPDVRELFGLAMMFLVADLVGREQAGRFMVPKWLTFLGAASYAIYLVHNPVGALVARFFDQWAAAFAASFIIGTLLGIAYHLAVERPLLRWRSGRPVDKAERYQRVT